MHLIKYENYEVVPTEEFFLIKPLRDLYSKYGKKDWDKFMQYVSVIYHYADPRSSYSYIIDDEIRLLEIIELEGLPKSFKITKELLDCIDVYKERIITASFKLLKSTKIAVDKLSKFLEEIDLNERDEKGRPLYTISSIALAIKLVPLLSKDLRQAEKIITAEIEEDSRIRGGSEYKAVMEDGIDFDTD